MGCGKKIFSPGDQRYPLHGIIDNHGKMVARRQLVARKNDVANQLRPHKLNPVLTIGSAAMLLKSQSAGRLFDGFSYVEPKRVRSAVRNALRSALFG